MQLVHLQWRKSTRSGNNAACVEVAGLLADGRAVRDSKNPTGPALVINATQWAAFTAGACSGDFD